MTRRNTFETLLAFLGLGMVVYGGKIQEGTLTGSVVFVVGFVVCWIGIAPWKIYARNYVCPVCRDSFGGGKEGSISESSHLNETHPDFYRWSRIWTHLSVVLMVLLFGLIPTIVLASSIPSLNGLANWVFLVFVGLGVVLALDFIDFHFVTESYRKKWILLNPEPDEEKDSRILQIGPEKLTEGVAAWNKFTGGREQLFGGLMAAGLKKKGSFASGYGIYFTSQRIIGVKTSRWFVLILIIAALGGIGGGVAISLAIGPISALAYLIAFPIITVVIGWGQRRLRFDDTMTLEELDKRKDFDIRRDNISEIELKRPGAVRRGHLTILPKSGKTVGFLITQEPGLFDRLQGLVSGFSFVPPPTWHKEGLQMSNYSTQSTQDTLSQRDDYLAEELPEVLDEKHVESRDFQLCPHCATMVPRDTTVCPSCGKMIAP
jgi:hypothetical protein